MRFLYPLLILVAAALAACATTEPTTEPDGALQGQAGPLAWAVSQVRQTRQEGGLEITWWYTLVLRNTGTSAIRLQRIVKDVIVRGKSVGGQGTEPFVVRVKPGDDIRLDTQKFTFDCRDCDRGYAESIFHEGVVDVRQFEGADEQGRAVRATIRIRFDSGIGPVLSRRRQHSSVQGTGCGTNLC